MILAECPIHKRIFICGKWCDETDVEIEATMRQHEHEITLVKKPCDNCWAEKVPP